MIFIDFFRKLNIPLNNRVKCLIYLTKCCSAYVKSRKNEIFESNKNVITLLYNKRDQ